MNKLLSRRIFVAVLLSAVISVSDVVSQSKFDIVHFSTQDKGKIEAAYFDAGTGKVVIFAHGAIFNKESWYFLAEKFQQTGVSSLCVDFRGYGNSTANNLNDKKYDIIAAIRFLNEKGFKEIDLIGASMGGAVVLSALNDKPGLSIGKIVLLAPAGGAPIKSKSMQKLFVVSKDEGLYDRVKSIFDKSAKPKTLKVFKGNAHAQHLFKTGHADELTNLCIKFITD